jgi:hypothetical protein
LGSANHNGSVPQKKGKEKEKEILNLKDIHPQCPSNSHTHIPWSFMLKHILIIFENYENKVLLHQKLISRNLVYFWKLKKSEIARFLCLVLRMQEEF